MLDRSQVWQAPLEHRSLPKLPLKVAHWTRLELKTRSCSDRGAYSFAKIAEQVQLRWWKFGLTESGDDDPREPVSVQERAKCRLERYS